MSVLTQQRDEDHSRSHGDLQAARDEVTSLKHDMEAAAAERDREMATVTKDRDKWRQTAGKYEREIDSLQGDHKQQSLQWQKTAEIQGNAIITYLAFWVVQTRLITISDGRY